MHAEICRADLGGTWVPEPRDNFRPEIHQIIQCDGVEIGYIALIDAPDGFSLEKLYILPSHRGRGIGTSLLRRVIERAHACNKPIGLRVLRVNPAQRLYERNGFSVDRSTKERHFMSYRASVAATGDHQNEAASVNTEGIRGAKVDDMSSTAGD